MIYRPLIVVCDILYSPITDILEIELKLRYKLLRFYKNERCLILNSYDKC